MIPVRRHNEEVKKLKARIEELESALRVIESFVVLGTSPAGVTSMPVLNAISDKCREALK